MSEESKFEKYEDMDGESRIRNSSMRRRSIANSRTRNRKRNGSSPAKFNGIHRRRSKRSSW